MYVWDDIKFLERVLEFTGDESIRKEIAFQVKEARERIVKHIEEGFVNGDISREVFKNVLEHYPNSSLVKEQKRKGDSVTRELSKVFARKAIDSFVKKAKEAQA
jgi:signal recognition particle GTPase